jgi:ABC-type transporter Mla subunit MlaD
MADPNSVGSLYFDVSVPDKEINDLLKQLEQIRKQAQQALELKSTNPLGSILKETNTAAKELAATYKELAKDGKVLGDALAATAKKAGTGSKPLTDLEKAAKGAAASYKGIIAEQKAGLTTSAQAVDKLKALATALGQQLKSADQAEAGYSDIADALTRVTTFRVVTFDARVIVRPHSVVEPV